MCHRIYKNIVLITNKQDLPRDLTSYELIMQALQFLAEGWNNSQHPNIGEALHDLFHHGLFNCLYFRPDHRPRSCQKKDKLICDETVANIYLHGQKWTTARLHEHSLPQALLTNMQAGELGDAYKEQGDPTLKLPQNISYFNGVSYEIQGADTYDGKGSLKDAEWVNVTVRVGDILEILLDGGSQHFVKVLGVMQHMQSVFFVIAWLSPIGQHLRFHLTEYKQELLFEYSTFFSLKTIDHPQYVNLIVLHKLNDRFICNDWIFNVV